MPYRRIAALLVVFCSALAAADIVEDVRTSLAHQNPAAAESQLNIYKLEHGTTSEYIEALSWMARSALAAKQFDKAETDAKETESLVRQQLAHSKLDTDQHLATALGAAIEVQAQVLAARGQQAQAVALLRRNIATYTKTSIQPRLQKNLNLLALVGQPAPPLSLSEYFGPKPVALAQLKGSPVLLFFWAHWCPDCKIEGPIIAQLLSEFGPKGPDRGGPDSALRIRRPRRRRHTQRRTSLHSTRLADVLSSAPKLSRASKPGQLQSLRCQHHSNPGLAGSRR